jgi:hypothetical protein
MHSCSQVGLVGHAVAASYVASPAQTSAHESIIPIIPVEVELAVVPVGPVVAAVVTPPVAPLVEPLVEPLVAAVVEPFDVVADVDEPVDAPVELLVVVAPDDGPAPVEPFVVEALVVPGAPPDPPLPSSSPHPVSKPSTANPQRSFPVMTPSVSGCDATRSLTFMPALRRSCRGVTLCPSQMAQAVHPPPLLLALLAAK